ncbi:hypothetical protein ACN9MN_18155 [Chryseobacterium sp. S-02]|uniref:hypothetical protein n=1 Tax=Chryseobacterium sp. S-02 TaxID=3404064 RepID=UPI003CF27011
MKNIALILFIFYSVIKINAQEIKFRDNIDKDSLFSISVQKLPVDIRNEYKKNYSEGNDQAKEFLLFMISMPQSSKKELIENFKTKKTEILNLKSEYQKLVPKNFIVDIEFEPASKILTTNEKITIKIYIVKDEKKDSSQKNDNLKVISQNWNLKPESKELEKVLKSIGWTDETLKAIKKLLDNANCISVDNRKITTIGFSRSGLGKYSYKIFNHSLDQTEKEEYNNGCEYIFYEENIVLEYGGGATGPQCFEHE